MNLCNFCLQCQGNPVEQSDFIVIEELFKVSKFDLNICTKCKKSLESFHTFYVMVKENLDNVEVIVEPEIKNVKVEEVKEEIDDDGDDDYAPEFLEVSEEKTEETECDDRVTCDECGKSLKRISFRKHRRLHRKAEVAGKEITGVKTLDEEDKIECEECGKMLMKSSIAKHRRRHRLKMDMPKKVKEKTTTTISRKALQQLGPARYTCDLCQKVFKLYRSMKEHILNVHLNIYKYICNICGMGLNNSDSLQKHILYIHHKKDKDKCELCGRLVKNMKQHMNATHDQKSSLVCAFCGRGFVNKKSHSRHVKLAHEGGRHKYKCTVCAKGYAGKIQLKEHMQVHLGGFLYSCEFCTYQVNYKRNLRAHVKKQHTKEWIAQRHEYLSSIYDISMLPTNSNNPGIALPNIECSERE